MRKTDSTKQFRDTWARDVSGADVIFFLGDSRATDTWQLANDQISLECPDDYNGLPYKTKAICKWAWDRDYTHIFLCDSDTFLMPARLLDSGFENFDYVGHFNGARGIPNAIYGSLYSWASGGSGYWLSRRAMEIVADSDPIPLSICPISKIPCEDLSSGQLMGPLITSNAIIVSHDPRYARATTSRTIRLRFRATTVVRQRMGVRHGLDVPTLRI